MKRLFLQSLTCFIRLFICFGNKSIESFGFTNAPALREDPNPQPSAFEKFCSNEALRVSVEYVHSSFFCP